MNAAHAHLLVNHLAPLATLLALSLLLLGLVQRRNPDTLRAAALILFLAGAGTLAADWTGDAAEDLVEAFTGVDEEPIHLHKAAAERAVPVGVILGVGAILLTLYDARSNGRRRLLVTAALLFGTALSAALLTSAAYSGGQIRHPEARPGFDLKQLTEPHLPQTEDL